LEILYMCISKVNPVPLPKGDLITGDWLFFFLSIFDSRYALITKVWSWELANHSWWRQLQSLRGGQWRRWRTIMWRSGI
jgi:hypothetical protein